MKKNTLVQILWGDKSKLIYLLMAGTILIFSYLGSREIWTQEHRWADIVAGMFYRHDFLHPYLGEYHYYDKPLLSYWLIIFFTKILGQFNAWALRLPSACAGLCSVFSIYLLGCQIKNKSLGLLSGWLLLTSFFFLYWARVSSADMLNLAGTLLAITWYYLKREDPTFKNYLIFFLIVAFTSLCKGLIGAIIPFFAIAIDICLRKSLKEHLRLSLLMALLIGTVIFLTPFLASSYFDEFGYNQNGLYYVYKENILRFFQPFDHQGSIYTYFEYLPIYLMPWTILFVPALLSIPQRWKNMSIASRWITFTIGLIFLFLTVSGSRRSYYILPIIPFCILFIADWILSISHDALLKWIARIILFCLLSLFVVVDLVPAWYYQYYGEQAFASKVLPELENKEKKFKIILLDASSKLSFYLKLAPIHSNYDVIGERENQSDKQLKQAWPFLAKIKSNTIILTRQRYLAYLNTIFKNFKVIYTNQLGFFRSYLADPNDNSIALILCPASKESERPLKNSLELTENQVRSRSE